MKKGISKIIIQAALTGLITGIIVACFKLSIEHLFDFVKIHFFAKPILFLLITTLGGMFSGLLVFKLAPETSGSGIPYVKIALMKSGAAIRLRTIFVKFLAGVLGIGTGLSLGREGPSVQLGAGAGSFVGRIFNLKGSTKENLIAAGAGAAIGATFNAPIAGAVFVLEELTRKFSPKLLFMCIIATAVSSYVGRCFLGPNPAFNVHLIPISINASTLMFCIITGILTGLLGILFTKTIFFFNNLYSKITVLNYYKPAIAGFFTGILGLFLPYILSSGNTTVEALLNYKFSIILVLLILIAKFLVTPLCFGSGAAGGIFLPMLTIGAFCGYSAGVLANHLGVDINLIAAASLGMAGFLSAVARTPLTAIVMVFEMTGGYECILPIMLTVAIAEFTAEKFNQKPIYSKLALKQYKNLGLNISNDLQVKDVMSQPKTFLGSTPLPEIAQTMKNEKHSVYPITNENNQLLGIVEKDDIKDALAENKIKQPIAGNFLSANPVTAYENEDLFTVFFRIHENSENSAIVVDKENHVIGIVSRTDIFNENL